MSVTHRTPTLNTVLLCHTLNLFCGLYSSQTLAKSMHSLPRYLPSYKEVGGKVNRFKPNTKAVTHSQVHNAKSDGNSFP